MLCSFQQCTTRKYQKDNAKSLIKTKLTQAKEATLYKWVDEMVKQADSKLQSAGSALKC